MTYVDGFVIPMPKKMLPAYRRMAAKSAKVWRDHGALDYKECVAEDLAPDTGEMKLPPSFPKMTKLKRGETIVFSYIVYKSRAHRDRVNAKVMNDPRILAMMDPKEMPFDMKRMAYGGFSAMVEF